jgi:hypothetical protein
MKQARQQHTARQRMQATPAQMQSQQRASPVHLHSRRKQGRQQACQQKGVFHASTRRCLNHPNSPTAGQSIVAAQTWAKIPRYHTHTAYSVPRSIVSKSTPSAALPTNVQPRPTR